MKRHTLIHRIGLGAATLAGMGFLVTAFPGPGQAGDRSRATEKVDEKAVIRAAMKRGELIPLPNAINIARKLVPGDVIKVDLELEQWGIKYEVKILTPGGRVREVELNARTGALIKIEDD